MLSLHSHVYQIEAAHHLFDKMPERVGSFMERNNHCPLAKHDFVGLIHGAGEVEGAVAGCEEGRVVEGGKGIKSNWYEILLCSPPPVSPPVRNLTKHCRLKIFKQLRG